MDQHNDSQRLISAEGPINRRTALSELRQHEAKQIHPKLMERMVKVRLRNQMGVPLSQRASIESSKETLPSGKWLFIFSTMLACGAVLILLGLIQSSLTTLLGGVLIGAVALIGTVSAHKARKPLRPQIQTVPALFDTDTLEIFDDAIDQYLEDLPQIAIDKLKSIKNVLAQMNQHSTVIDDHFTQEDRLYLKECLKRYIPDSIEAFVRVPNAQRKTILLQGQPSPETLLLQQLTLIHEEILAREKKIGCSAAENLLKQSRFLASKQSR